MRLRIVAGRGEEHGGEENVGARALELRHRAKRGLLAAKLELAARLGEPAGEDRVERAAVAGLVADQVFEFGDGRFEVAGELATRRRASPRPG